LNRQPLWFESVCAAFTALRRTKRAATAGTNKSTIAKLIIMMAISVLSDEIRPPHLILAQLRGAVGPPRALAMMSGGILDRQDPFGVVLDFLRKLFEGWSQVRGGRGMSERMVEVWDRLYIITVERISESVWEVVGDYMFESIKVQGETEGTALQRWRETARDKGGG
jgi:hypothetical protein